MIKHIILGTVQGITEFLPVSSSGHLVILQKVFGMNSQELALSIILHLGTTFAMVIFFFKDILKLFSDLKMLLLIALVTAVTGIIGLSGKTFFESLFSSPTYVATALIFTGIILILTRNFMQSKRSDLNMKDAFILGLAQGLSIIPGISRSGITISSLLFRGINRDVCFKFSFLASIPAVLGVVIVEAKEMGFVFKGNPQGFAVGFLCSFIVGLLTLGFLREIIHKAKLHYFGYYCIFIAAITLLFIK